MKTKKQMKRLIGRIESIEKQIGLRHELSKGISVIFDEPVKMSDTVTVEYDNQKKYITTDKHPILKEGIYLTLEENGHDERIKTPGCYFTLSAMNNSILSIDNNWIKELKS